MMRESRAEARAEAMLSAMSGAADAWGEDDDRVWVECEGRIVVLWDEEGGESDGE